MDKIKEAFKKVKEDIDFLKNEVNSINFFLEEINDSILELRNSLKNKEKYTKKQENNMSYTSTNTLDIKTDPLFSSTQKTLFSLSNDQNLRISTGNEGVSTDRQTLRQTDRHIEKPEKEGFFEPSGFSQNSSLKEQTRQENIKDPIQNAAEALESLDTLKKEIRLKFKRLTEREWLVFSTMYQVEEEKGYSDYKALSNQLKLTESSIRDYVGRLIIKGIPVEKKRINNKTIHLFISKNLKKVASLSTIIQLREL